MDQKSKIYDLGERTSVFSERLIEFLKRIETIKASQIIITQLIKSGTSMGANYMEAKNGSSKKDFINKINICKKEAQETEYWLRLLKKYYPQHLDQINSLSKETHELLLIFQKIISSSKVLKINT